MPLFHRSIPWNIERGGTSHPRSDAVRLWPSGPISRPRRSPPATDPVRIQLHRPPLRQLAHRMRSHVTCPSLLPNAEAPVAFG
jgi:hypothetical protein